MKHRLYNGNYMGSVTPKIISKSSDEYITFKELQDDFFLSSLMNIKISHSHHFIVFDFTISGEDPFLIKNGFVKSFTYTHKLFANKFYFAKSYNLSSPKVFDEMPFFLYNNKGPNILIENNTKSDTNIFAETDFIIADGIDKELILIPSPPVGNKYKSSLEIIVNQIMDTSVWEFIKD